MGQVNSIYFLFILTLFTIPPLNAAEVRIVETEFEDSEPMILIKGQIIHGDNDKIKSLSKKLLVNNPNAELRIILNSQGGDVLEAIEIGKFLRSMLADVGAYGRWVHDPNSKDGKIHWSERFNDKSIYPLMRIFKNRNESLNEDEIPKCYSACILILVAGVNRHYSDTIDERIVIDPNGDNPWKKYPTIGLHRPYFDKNIFSKMSATEADAYYRKLELLTKTHLEEMGASPVLIEKMLRTKSTEIEKVDMYKFRPFLSFAAPFFEEWNIAKCGDLNSENGLTATELKEYKKLKDTFRKSTLLPDFYNQSAMARYFEKEENFKIGKSQTLGFYSQKIKNSNRNINSCAKKIIREHQLKTIKELKI